MLKLFSPILEDLCVRLLKYGPMPKHVAFVADGARRFGKKYKIPVQENHEVGLYGIMLEVIDWCVILGIAEYSILMYSFGNYYRPKDEIKHWIDVLKIWLIKCIINWRILKKKGIRFNFYGKLRLIPIEISSLMGILVLLTKDNKKLTVNMAMGYTGKHEMSTVANNLCLDICDGKIKENNLTCDLFMECLFAVENHNVDLLIRTSGFHRISDFLNWQTSNGFIYFSDVLWPEFSKYHFLKAVLYYQCHAKKEIKQNISQFGDDEESYLEHMKRKTKYSLLSYCIEMNFFPADTNLNKLYSYDYETIYDCFKLSYKVGDWFI